MKTSSQPARGLRRPPTGNAGPTRRLASTANTYRPGAGASRTGRGRVRRATAFTDDMAAFLEDCQARALSPRTVVRYRDELGLLARFLERCGIASTDQVTAQDIRRFMAQLRERRKPASVHDSYRVMRRFFGWWQHEHQLDTNPMELVAAPKVVFQQRRPASAADVKAIVETCDDGSDISLRDRAALLALIDCGLRAREMLSLDVGDVDLGGRMIAVRFGKGGKERRAPIGDRTRGALSAYMATRPACTSDDALFVTNAGTRLTYAGLRQIVRRRAARAGVPAPPLHSWRRLFATTMNQRQTDMFALQRLLGHSDISVARRYVWTDDADLREAHRRADPVEAVLEAGRIAAARFEQGDAKRANATGRGTTPRPVLPTPQEETLESVLGHSIVAQRPVTRQLLEELP